MKLTVHLIFIFLVASLTAQEYSVLSIPTALTEHANSVILEENIVVDVSNLQKVKTSTRKVVAVLNEHGKDHFDLYEFYNENSKVKNIEVTVYNAFGKKIDNYKKHHFTDVSRTGNNMYSDSRVVYLQYTPAQYPYVIVFESELESGDSAHIIPWYPLDSYSQSAVSSIMTLKFNPSRKPRYKGYNLDGNNITIEEKPEELVFSASNLPAVRYEEHSPIYTKIFPNVIFGLDKFYLKGKQGNASTWEEFGLWMQKELLDDVQKLPKATVGYIQNLVANETTNEAKARKIYKYVQGKVRYISIQVGIGGWKPMPASDVDKLSYGDCKALTNYTKALLDAVGVPSYYTVIYGNRTKWDIIEDFVSLQGNHIILGIPDNDKITWLECTSQDTPFGYLGDFTDDRNVLIITPEGGKIVRSEIYTPKDNSRTTTAKVKIASSGKLMAQMQSVSKGIEYGSKYLLPKKKKDDLDKYYKNRWNHINGFSISRVEFENDEEEIVFTENVDLEISNYLFAVGDDYLFSPNIFNRNNHIPTRYPERNHNLYLGNGFLHSDTIEVEIPDNYKVDALPEPTVLESNFGKYEISFAESGGNKLTFTRNLLIANGEYPPSEYENYRSFLQNISKLDQTKILLKRI